MHARRSVGGAFLRHMLIGSSNTGDRFRSHGFETKWLMGEEMNGKRERTDVGAGAVRARRH